jgi:threonine aldolase
MYYPWPSGGLAKDRILVRLVTSFQTTNEDVEKFLAVVRS